MIYLRSGNGVRKNIAQVGLSQKQAFVHSCCENGCYSWKFCVNIVRFGWQNSFALISCLSGTITFGRNQESRFYRSGRKIGFLACRTPVFFASRYSPVCMRWSRCSVRLFVSFSWFERVFLASTKPFCSKPRNGFSIVEGTCLRDVFCNDVAFAPRAACKHSHLQKKYFNPFTFWFISSLWQGRPLRGCFEEYLHVCIGKQTNNAMTIRLPGNHAGSSFFRYCNPIFYQCHDLNSWKARMIPSAMTWEFVISVLAVILSLANTQM